MEAEEPDPYEGEEGANPFGFSASKPGSSSLAQLFGGGDGQTRAGGGGWAGGLWSPTRAGHRAHTTARANMSSRADLRDLQRETSPARR